MMNSLFPKHIKGSRGFKRDRGRSRGRKGRFLHPKSSYDLSLAGDGILKNRALLLIQGCWRMLSKEGCEGRLGG